MRPFVVTIGVFETENEAFVYSVCPIESLTRLIHDRLAHCFCLILSQTTKHAFINTVVIRTHDGPKNLTYIPLFFVRTIFGPDCYLSTVFPGNRRPFFYASIPLLALMHYLY